MCPFSHGFFFVLSVCCCLQSLNVNGSKVSSVYHDNDSRATQHTHQSLLTLPPPPPHSPTVEQARRTDDQQVHPRGFRSPALVLPQLQEGRGGQFVWGSHLPNPPARSSKPNGVYAAAGGFLLNALWDKTNSLSSLPVPQFAGGARSFTFRTGVAKSFTSFRTGFASDGKSERAGSPARQDKSDGRGEDAVFGRSEDSVQALYSVSSQNRARSKRSPKRNKRSKQHGGGDATPPIMSTANSDTAAPHLTHTPKELLRRKVSDKRAKKMEAKVRRRQKAGLRTTTKNPQESPVGDGDVENEGSVIESNDAVNKLTPSWNVLANLSSPEFPAMSSEQGAVDVIGPSAVSSPEQQINSTQQDSVMIKPTPYLGLDGRPLNLTQLFSFLKKKEFQRQLDRQAQWAYICMVVLICLMMWAMWYLGGLHRCRYRPDNMTYFTDNYHTLSVEEVLKRRQRYLPMFNEPEWEEVLMCNRGSDP